MSFLKFFQKVVPSAEEPQAPQEPVIEEDVMTPEKLDRKHLFEQLQKAIKRIVGYAADGSVITNEIDNEIGLTEALSAVLGHKMKGFRANRLLSISVLLEMGLEALPPTIKIPPFSKELRDSSLLMKNKAWIVYCLNNHVMYATIDVIIRDFAADSYEEAGILSYPETSVMILGLMAPLDEIEFELTVEPTQAKETSAPSTPVTYHIERTASPIQPAIGSPKPKAKSINSHSMSSLPTCDDGIVVAKTKKVRKKTRPAQQHAPLAESDSDKKDEIIAGLEKQVEELKKENSAQKNTIASQQKDIMRLKQMVKILEKSLAAAKAEKAKRADVVESAVTVANGEEQVKKEEMEQEQEQVKKESDNIENTDDIPVAKKQEDDVIVDETKEEEKEPVIDESEQEKIEDVTSTSAVEEEEEIVVKKEEQKQEEIKQKEEEIKQEEKEEVKQDIIVPKPQSQLNNNANVNDNEDSNNEVIKPSFIQTVVEKPKELKTITPSVSPVSKSPGLLGRSNTKASPSVDYDDFVILPRENGTFKNGSEVDKKFERVVTKICIRAAKSVQYISFEFSDGKIVSQGVTTGDELSITLKPGQYVNAIYGRKSQQSLDRILIKFNTGDPFGPFGSQDGPDTFAFYAEEDEYLYNINIAKSKKLFSQDPASVVPVWKTFK